MQDSGGVDMKARLQLAMLRMEDPRLARAFFIGLALVLAFVAQTVPGGTEAVYACPSTGGGGCTGG